MVIPSLSIISLISAAGRSSAVTFQIIKDNNSSAIEYAPSGSWIHLPGNCEGCVKLPSNLLINSNGTYTNGTFAIKVFDEDDIIPSKEKQKVSLVAQPLQKDGDDKDDDDDKKGKKDDSDSDSAEEKEEEEEEEKKGKKDDDEDDKKQTTPSASQPDADDPNFVPPPPVNVTFRFSGREFVLHALVPTVILPGGAPSNTNVSFTLNGASTGPAFTSFPTESGQDFKDMEILRLSGLEDKEHVVVGNLAPGSTLIVSYVNLTMEDTNSGSSTADSSTAISGSAASSTDPATMKKNAKSFAVIIGSVVGVLATLSLSIFLSLCCRRRKARKRLALIRAEEEQAEIREYGGRLQGPRPFQPRYFPGTVPPFEAVVDEVTIPPAYNSNEGTTRVMISPLPPPPPPPPPPPIFSDTLQIRDTSNVTPPSVSRVFSPTAPPVSLIAHVNGSPPVIPPLSTDELASTPVIVRRIRPQPSMEIREDETSDGELGGLLSSGSHDRSLARGGDSDSGSETGEDR